MFLDKRNIYEHRIILPYLIKTNLCKNVKFQPCLEPSIESINNVPTFYGKMIKNEEIICPCSLTYLQLFFPSFYGLSLILKLTIKKIFFSSFANKNINFVGQIFHHNGKTKSWDCTKSEDNLNRKLNNPRKIVAFN